MDVAPDADPDEAAWLEKIAKIALDVDKDRSPPSNSPWLDDKKNPLQ